MDANVVAAMAKWPDVPDVYGWLSLSERGEWRLHPDGGALADPQQTRGVQAGEPITSPSILDFIGRNYAVDGKGQWYFQNGPQRVYVRLDAAPYVLHLADTEQGGAMLRTHNDLWVNDISGWWLTDEGRLFAATEHGAGLVAGRDLSMVLGRLHTAEGLPLLETLQEDIASACNTSVLFYPNHGAGMGNPNQGKSAIPINCCPPTAIGQAMGFVRWPSG